MAENSKIEWTDATWNPITGCSVVSPGCQRCYAMKLAGTRLAQLPSRAGLTVNTKAGPVWTGEVRFNAEWLDQPLRWRRARMIFVCAHGDLFHEAVPDEWIDRVFAVMALAPQHTFQVLTKRAERMRGYVTDPVRVRRIYDEVIDLVVERKLPFLLVAPGTEPPPHLKFPRLPLGRWPLPNVWLGVSAEDQERADERIPHLLETPAAVRFLSAEPLLGPIDLTNLPAEPIGPDECGAGEHCCRDLRLDALDNTTRWCDAGRSAGVSSEIVSCPSLDWVIVGGESGPGARECWVPNIRSLLHQCKAAGVPFFGKQLGAFVTDRNDADWEGCTPEGWPDVDPYDIEHDIHGHREEYQGAPVRVRLRDKKGGDMAEWPADLRVREMPHAAR